MAVIEVRGPKSECIAIMCKIVNAVPGCRPTGYAIQGGCGCICDFVAENYDELPESDELIQFCNTWRSKWDVCKKFDCNYKNATKMLDDLVVKGLLHRVFDDSNQGKRFIYIDSSKNVEVDE